MRVILYKAQCFHLHRLFHLHIILHISVSTSHQTSILHIRKPPLAILQIWHISQHQVFFNRDKVGNENSFINNRYVFKEV